MKNKNIRKVAVSLALLQTLTLSGCKSNNTPVKLSNFERTIDDFFEPDTIIDDNNVHHPYRVNLTESEYTDILEDNIMDINFGCRIYNKYGKDIGEVSEYKRVTAIKRNDTYTLINLDDKEVYVKTDNLMSVPNLNNSEYITSIDDKDKVINDLVYIYNSDGRYIGYKWSNELCTEVASNQEYSLVIFEDGTEGYVRKEFLSSVVQKIESYGYLRKGTNLYADKELTISAGTTNHDYITYVFLKGNDYAYIGDIDYRENYYIKSDDVELYNDFITVNNYGYVNGDIQAYSDKELTQNLGYIDNASLVYVYNMNNNWAEIYNENDHKFCFINTSNLKLLGERFIDVDLGDQRASCYISGRYTEVYKTRTGKDSTPTHEGVFDIDWMAKDWKFSNYDNCYANHWIPYNEFGEGFHDLIGDDEVNYGNEAYHNYGSHGCVRVPADGSEYIYDNYEVGDIVLVHK